MEYVEIDVRLDHLTSDKYSLCILKSPGGEASTQVSAPIFPDEFLSFWPNAAQRGSKPQRPTRDMADHSTVPTMALMKECGSILFDTLFSGDARTRFIEACAFTIARRECGVRIRIRGNPLKEANASILSLPWELLFNRETRDFLALDRRFSIVRYLELPRTAELPLPKPPVRIGVLRSNPNDLTSLEISKELRSIQDAQRTSHVLRVFAFRYREARNLRAQLRSKNINILHYMGHGTMDVSNGSGLLVLEDSSGKSASISGTSLATITKGIESLRIVVLNACDTAATSNAYPVAGVASALMLGGIPAVIGMQLPFSDSAAITFSKSFYRHLAQGAPIEEALTESRLAIFSADPSNFEWMTPALFLRTNQPHSGYVPPSDQDNTSDSTECSEEGMKLLQAGDLHKAEALLRKAKLLDPANRKIAVNLCLCLMSDRLICDLSWAVADEIRDTLGFNIRQSSALHEEIAGLLLGILYYDFYRPRNSAEELPWPQVLLGLSKKIPSAAARRALDRVHVSREAALLLNLRS